jgi:hypothetical protein
MACWLQVHSVHCMLHYTVVVGAALARGVAAAGQGVMWQGWEVELCARDTLAR